MLAGFSFGAAVACRAALTAAPVCLITIAPPPDRARKLLEGRRPEVPWLVIQGEADAVVSSRELTKWIDELGPGPELVLLPSVDHFFHGNLTLLRQTIVGHLGSRA